MKPDFPDFPILILFLKPHLHGGFFALCSLIFVYLILKGILYLSMAWSHSHSTFILRLPGKFWIVLILKNAVVNKMKILTELLESVLRHVVSNCRLLHTVWSKASKGWQPHKPLHHLHFDKCWHFIDCCVDTHNFCVLYSWNCKYSSKWTMRNMACLVFNKVNATGMSLQEMVT